MDSLRVFMISETFAQKILSEQNADMFISNLLSIARLLTIILNFEGSRKCNLSIKLVTLHFFTLQASVNKFGVITN